MPDEIDAQLKALERMNVPQLKERYAEVFGEPTKAHHRTHLIHRIAWRIQALREGGLSERAKRRAAELANEADLRVRPPKRMPEPAADGTTVQFRLGPPRDPRLPKPGTVLRRRYKDRTLVVRALDEGFEYEGERYRSLTAVARKATGSNWNGMHFFGLARPAGKDGGS